MVTIRSEGIGSLLRPPYLLEARARVEAGDLEPAEFKKIEDRAVDESVALQDAAGLDVVTDGEQRRYAFFGHLIESLEGFDKFAGWAIPFHDEQGNQLTLKRPVVVDKLRWRRQMTVEEFTYLRGADEPPRQGDARERPAGRRVLRQGQVDGGLRHSRRVSRRPRGLHAP